TITMAMMPNASCHQRFPADVDSRISTVLVAVTTASFSNWWRPYEGLLNGLICGGIAGAGDRPPTIVVSFLSHGWFGRELVPPQLTRSARHQWKQASRSPANIDSIPALLLPG